MREPQTDPKAPGLVASAVALGVAAGASGEAGPLDCEHEQIVTRARQAWRIDMGGTVDGANTRDPVGYGVYGQAWEPNRHVLMENVGDDEVVNPWVLVDGRRDWRSVDHILSGILEPEMTEAQKARAIWEFARRRRYHSTPGTDEVKDTVKMLNVYGYTLCWDAAYTMSNLWQRAGLKIRRGLPHGHCTTEVYYDGAYHLLDSDEHLLVLMRDNRTVAGEAEISRDHDLMKRSHAYGILRPEDRRTNEFSASLFCYLGPRSGGRPYIGGHRMEITLRPGEGLRWEWADRGRYHGLSDQPPPRLANGRLHYRPRLDAGFARWTEASANLEGGDGGLRVLDPEEEGSVVYRLRSPYVFVGGRVRVQLAPGSGPWRLELAREGDEGWTHLADIRGDGEFTLDDGLPRQEARYDYRLRLRGSGGGIASLEIESDLQMAPLSLPALELGANEIVYTDESPGPRRVRVVHAWQERDDLAPPAAPAKALHPLPGAEVAGTRVRFRWEPVPEAVDYHFELSRHPDMRRILSPVFEKLSSKTPAAGQAHWEIPFEGLLNPGESYYWRVRARTAEGLWGPWSEVWSFTPRAPGVPRGLELAADWEARSITLRWRPAEEGTPPRSYEIYGSDERGFTASADSYAVFDGAESRDVPGNRLAATGDTSIVVAGAGLPPEAGNRGFYRVVAVDADGIRSGPSDYVEAPRPFIYSTPPRTIAAGERLQYQVRAVRSIGDLRAITDPAKQEDPGAGGRYQAAFRDGDELLFILDEAPPFITLDRETGAMTLAPGAADMSTHTVTVRVQNQNGGVDVQGWDVRVVEAPPATSPVP